MYLPGYSHYQKGYVLEQLHDKKVVVRRDVSFDESSRYKQPTDHSLQQEGDPLAIDDSIFEINLQYVSPPWPKTYREAVQLPEGKLWHEAALREMQAHEENETWTLVSRPKDVRPIAGRWVFTKKRDQCGNETYKARFVAKGYSQVYGIDYHETYTSVLQQQSLRLLITIAVNNQWEIYQRDFKTAYLNAPLLTPIYIRQPEGFIEQGGEDKVCLLNKALYGLKQAGRAWQQELFTLISQNGYVQSKKEPCIWFKAYSKTMRLITIYVDGILLTGNDEDEIKKISKIMGKEFKMKDLGKIQEFLGIQVIRTNDGMKLCQRKYAEQVVKKFGQTNSKASPTPMTSVYENKNENDNENIDNNYPIKQALGSLMYLSNSTRPDSFA